MFKVSIMQKQLKISHDFQLFKYFIKHACLPQIFNIMYSVSNNADNFKNRNMRYIREAIAVCHLLGLDISANASGRRILSFSLTVFGIICTLYTIYGNCAHITKANSLANIAETLGLILQLSITVLKLIYYLFIQEVLAELLHAALSCELLLRCEIFKHDFGVNAQLSADVERIMQDAWLNTRRQMLFFLCMLACSCSNYMFSALLQTFIDLAANNQQFTYPFPASFPDWGRTNMIVSFIIVTVADYVAGICALGFDGIFIILCVHCVAQVNALNLMLEHLTANEIPKHLHCKYLRYCIDQHRRIYSYFNKVRQIFWYISLPQFIMSLFILGVLLFVFSVGLENNVYTMIRMIMFLASATFETSLFCFNGQRLINASGRTSLQLYKCDWYNEDYEFRQLIKMLLMRTNNVYYFSVAGFAAMSIPTWVSVIKSSVSYFLLLRSL